MTAQHLDSWSPQLESQTELSIWPGPAPAAEGIWGVKQWVEALSLSVLDTLYLKKKRQQSKQTNKQKQQLHVLRDRLVYTIYFLWIVWLFQYT